MAAGFKNTGVEIARISKYKNLGVEKLHSQIIRHFKLPSERISQTLWPSSICLVISSYYVSRRIMASPTVYRNTHIYAHMNSHTVPTCRIGLDKQVLPVAEFCCIVNLILIYEIWGYVKLSSGHSIVLSIILKWNTIYTSTNTSTLYFIILNKGNWFRHMEAIIRPKLL